MKMNGMTSLWARTALIWFLVTLCFGMFMGMTQQFNYAPAHAHLGVLGWLSSAVFALIYGVAREGPEGARAPQIHWAAHNLGLALMGGSLFMLLRTSDQSWEPFIAIGGAVIVLAALWLTVMMWPRLAAR
ncbi:MAG: cytochrome-c oxidase [Alphaproteobacteria bacterium]|nr:cytochrome-c oxidase [Alphaproteobacteria bacterium]